ncbi:MAG TPA: LCP family protein [Anaerolineae bacterium]|nr:LCP family protein [Anaerolineae bacterium]
MDKKFLLIISLLILSLACTIPIAALNLQGSGDPEIKMLADLDLSNDISPTPFQPYQYTPSVAPQSQLILDSLVPNEGIQRPEGQINLLLLGSDWQTGRPSNNTDVILLVSIFTREEKISLVSFPRDLWVEVPGVGEKRINTTQAYGGFPLTVNTFEYNFGIHLDHYIMTNLNGFINIISILDEKIEINAATNLSDYCHLSHEQHRSWCSVGPGIEHLDSEMALWYVRSRYSTDDFDRTRRAQEVLEGIFKGLMSINAITKAPELYNQFASCVETDINLGDIIGLIDISPKILADPNRVRRYTIGRDHVTSHTFPTSGANVLLPNYDAIWQLLLEAVFTP